jgi:hypothetical protein
MYVMGRRIDNRPEQQLVRNVDPEHEREVLAEILRARRERENPPHRPWPEPEVPMRVVEAGAAPKSVARLLSRLRSAGWRTVVTYARGTTFDAQRRPGRVVGTYALRAASGRRRAVAIWWEGKAGKLDTQGVLVWGDRFAQWVGIQEFERGL